MSAGKHWGVLWLALVIGLFGAGRLAAAEPFLVKDIYTGAGTSPQAPRDLVAVGSTLYFAAHSVDQGVELWKSGGSAAGTMVVKDIRPGPDGSDPRMIGGVKGALLFEAADGSGARGLWRTDGTEAGTYPIKDLTIPWVFSELDKYTETVGDCLFFAAEDAASGIELWQSDGTAEGTVLVKDIFPGTSDAAPRCLARVGETLYFIDGAYNRDLWKSDGTTSGTVKVKRLCVGGDSRADHLTSVGGTLFFTANDGTHGVELWKSDGSAEGTAMVKDIYPNAATSTPQNLVGSGGKLFFTANDGSAGMELWKSDGTAAGTAMVRNIYWGNNISGPGSLTDVGGTLYFTADDGASGQELWKSDGTAAGTVMAKDICFASFGSTPQYLTNISGTLYFAANDGPKGTELWQSHAPANGTAMVKDIYPGGGSAAPQFLTNVSGNLFFVADDGLRGRELWAYLANGLAPAIKPVGDADIPDDAAYRGAAPELAEGTTPVGWSLAQGPAGMAIDARSGAVAWPAPTKTGSPFRVVIRATNAFGQAETSWTLTVGKRPVIAAPANDVTLDDRLYAGPAPTLIAGDAPITWSLLQAPGGMTIDPATGAVTWGAPNVSGSPYTIYIRAANRFGQDETSWTLTVGKLPVVAQPAAWYVPDNHAFSSAAPTVTAGSSPIRWSIVQAPAGMTVNAFTGAVLWAAPVSYPIPYTIILRAANSYGHTDVLWHLNVYHLKPPSAPAGGLELTYHIKTPSTVSDGQAVLYTYVWSSDKGDRVTHGPTIALSDTLTEMDLVQNGETWTVTVTPRCGSSVGPAVSASVRIIDIRAGVVTWSFYK